MMTFNYFVNALLTGLASDSPKTNWAVYNVPKTEIDALYEYFKCLFSKLEKEDDVNSLSIQRLSLGDISTVDSFEGNVKGFATNSKKGILLVDAIIPSDRYVFELFRCCLKEPENSNFPSGWMIVSFWDEDSIDEFDDGISSAVQYWSYSDYIEAGGIDIVSQCKSLKERMMSA